MLPGKTYSVEDILQIARKRIWWILVPFAVISAATAVVARKLPNLYRSEALIMVVPQRVPESFVRSTVTQKVEDRLLSIAATVLTRSQLEKIIQEMNLYQNERRSGAIMEDIVERMRLVDIQTRVERGDAFRLAYVGSSQRQVKDVAEKLASLFISENVRNRGNLADGTSQFLESQLEDARRNLKEQEEKVAEFRRKYAGELPSQLDSNIQVVRGLESQIQALVESLNDDRDRRLNYERAIADLEQELEDVPVSQSAPAPAAVPAGPTSTAAQKLAEAQKELAAWEKRYPPENPDLRRLKTRVKELEEEVKAQSPVAASTPDTGGAPALSPMENQRRKRLELGRIELAQLNRKIAENEKEEKRLREKVAGYQHRVEAVPTRETELTELTRGYESLKGIYDQRMKNLEDAKTAANLERRQIGEQFQMLEPARVPERPFSPNRQAINMMGMLAGLACGFAMVALLEYRDKSFKSDDEIVRVLTLPVLAVVPLMQSANEKQRAWRTQLLLGVGFGTLVASCLAVVVYTLVR